MLVENIQANAGICPKVDPNAEWIQKYDYGYENKKIDIFKCPHECDKII